MIGALLIISGCGTSQDDTTVDKPQQENVVINKPQSNVEEAKAQNAVSTKKVEILIPEKRTVTDIMDNGFPWYYLSLETTEGYLEDGEIVFLVEDGTELLKNISVSAESELEADNPNTREDLVKSWSEWLTLYVKNVEPYSLDNNNYFNKIKEVISAANKQEYDQVVKLVDEAEQLMN